MAKRKKAAKRQPKKSMLWDISIGIVILISVMLLTLSSFSSSLDAVVIMGIFVMVICFVAVFAGKGNLD